MTKDKDKKTSSTLHILSHNVTPLDWVDNFCDAIIDDHSNKPNKRFLLINTANPTLESSNINLLEIPIWHHTRNISKPKNQRLQKCSSCHFFFGLWSKWRSDRANMKIDRKMNTACRLGSGLDLSGDENKWWKRLIDDVRGWRWMTNTVARLLVLMNIVVNE